MDCNEYSPGFILGSIRRFNPDTTMQSDTTNSAPAAIDPATQVHKLPGYAAVNHNIISIPGTDAKRGMSGRNSMLEIRKPAVSFGPGSM
jgi:hypothetical protein